MGIMKIQLSMEVGVPRHGTQKMKFFGFLVGVSSCSDGEPPYLRIK